MSQRELLLEAAITCLNERGYGKTTSRDIAAAAGISSLAAVVYHYGSKEALLREAIAEIVRRWIDHLQQLMESTAGGIDGMRAAVDEYYDTLEANGPALSGFVEALALATHSDDVRSQLAEHYRGFRERLADIFEEMAPGQSRARLRTAASLLMALVDGILVQWLLDPDAAIGTDDLRQATLSLTATFLGPGETS